MEGGEPVNSKVAPNYSQVGRSADETAVAVVAHVARQDQAAELLHQVDADLISFDDGTHGERANHARALRWLIEHEQDAAWYVLLEDDAIPCVDFRVELRYRLKRVDPEALVSLYLGTGRWAGTVPSRHEPVVRGLVEKADESGANVIEAKELWHAVGIAVSAQNAMSLLSWLEAAPRRRPTDQAITDWAKHWSVDVLYTHPSLVDHRDDSPRLVGAPEAHVPRRAWKFLGA